MVCQSCQKNIANVHFTQVINGKKEEKYLCEQCANKEGSFNQHSEMMDMGNLFAGFMGMPNMSLYNPARLQEIACESCGMTFQQFQKTGKMGCEKCYDIYKDRIKPVLKRIHGNTKHNGRIPVKIAEFIDTEEEVKRLKKELEDAVSREEYERAAEIRDKIREMGNGR